jgi:transcriptional regulator with XRE-family HTH domain
MMDLIDIHLGRRLRRRRRILGLTQQQLAGACGVRFQQIQKYECAANRMSAARLWQLSEVLEVPVSYFYEGLRRTPAQDRETPSRRSHGAARKTNDLIRPSTAWASVPRQRLWTWPSPSTKPSRRGRSHAFPNVAPGSEAVADAARSGSRQKL